MPPTPQLQSYMKSDVKSNKHYIRKIIKWIVTKRDFSKVSMYCIDPTFLDRQVGAKCRHRSDCSGAVCSGSTLFWHSFSIFWTDYSMEKTLSQILGWYSTFFQMSEFSFLFFIFMVLPFFCVSVFPWSWNICIDSPTNRILLATLTGM